jgi:SAM-dependent methyltransferase
MYRSSATIPPAATRYTGQPISALDRHGIAVETGKAILNPIKRRWQRERRRRKVGRAYDMALEIARLIPANAQVLDIGCGNGFIVHHLTALLNARVIGIDLGPAAEAPIVYRQFSGIQIPLADDVAGAAVLCYVLHHARDVNVLLRELRRVLTVGGCVVVYEDIPATLWDRLVCWTHNLKWRRRTGVCTFRRASEWRQLFNSAGFEVVSERELSRWRNLAHPVRRRLFVLRTQPQEQSDKLVLASA